MGQVEVLPAHSGNITPQSVTNRLPRFRLALYILFGFAIAAWLQSPLLQIHKSLSASTLNPELKSHCISLLETPTGTYDSRLNRLVQALNINSDNKGSHGSTWIAEPGPSAFYFLGGFASSDWWLSERPFLVAINPSTANPNEANITLLTPEFERLRAQGIDMPEEIKERVTWVSWQEDESPYSVLWDHLGSAAGTGGLVVDGAVRAFILGGLGAATPKEIVDDGRGLPDEDPKDGQDRLFAVKEAVALVRQRKDEREIGLLRCANQMTLHAIRQTKKQMYIGISESKTRHILNKEIAVTGLEGEGGLILFGENAALPHGSGTDRVLGKEDLVLIDVGGRWGGYVADITRTFALPKSRIPKCHLEIWETVRQAQYAPFELLKASNSTLPPKLSELDITARNVISSQMPSLHERTGVDFSIFTHRLGHGIGLEGHEAPYLVQGPLGETRARSGHVFSLEPGVYLPKGVERGGVSGLGVRLEDCFVVTEDEDGGLGGEWLTGPVEKWGDI